MHNESKVFIYELDIKEDELNNEIQLVPNNVDMETVLDKIHKGFFVALRIKRIAYDDNYSVEDYVHARHYEKADGTIVREAEFRFEGSCCESLYIYEDEYMGGWVWQLEITE